MKGERILLQLSKLGMLNRNQIQKLCVTGGKRNTNYILDSLKPYIEFLESRYGRIYKLSQKGSNLMESPYLKWGNVEHRLLRNDVYIHYRPTKWETETEYSVGDITIIPDAFFLSGITYKFLEVDRTQRWYINRKKLVTYSNLKQTKAYQKKYGHFPTLVWVVEIESRKPKIKTLCNELNLHCEVYTKGELQ
jgi:hypothetical protein